MIDQTQRAAIRDLARDDPEYKVPVTVARDLLEDLEVAEQEAKHQADQAVHWHDEYARARKTLDDLHQMSEQFSGELQQ